MSFGQSLTRIKINVFVLFHLPWWIVKNIIPMSRPRPAWTFKRSVMVEVVRFLVTKTFAYGLSDGGTHEALKLGKGVLGTYVDPVPNLVRGDLAKWAVNANVTSAQIPGYWLHRRGIDLAMGGAPSPGNEKVFYFMHGGAYVSLSAHPSSVVSSIPKHLLKHCPSITRAFCIEYRLCKGDASVSSSSISSNPGPFPTALLDALAGYVHLIYKVGFKPQNVVFVGDSAGGNLALALTRYLIENQTIVKDLPSPPGSLILLSPWCDLSDSFAISGSSYKTNARSDYIVLPRKIASHSIAPDLFISAKQLREQPDFYLRSAYVSPASRLLKDEVSFEGWPRTFVNGGGAEVLIDQIRELVLRMRRDMDDERVEYVEAPEAVHDYLSHDICEEEKNQLLVAISKWISKTPSSLYTTSEVKASL